MKFLWIILFSLMSTSAIAQPKPGDMASEIALPDTRGSILRLSDLKGKVVLIDFWASWCGPCRKSNKDLSPVYARYNQKGFEILGISIDEDKEDWRKAIKYDRVKWLQVIESNGWDNGVAAKWKIEEIPNSFLLDKEGRIVAVDPTRKQIESYLKDQLGK